MEPRREIVEAGAGCGKTYSLVSRYVEAMGWDAETGERIRGSTALPPDQIVCLTFTELAASQMLERIVERLLSLSLDSEAESVIADAKISTFHSYCYRILSPHLARMGYKSTELVSASLARLERENYLVNQLSQHPGCQKLLLHLRIDELLDIGLKSWFEDAQRASGSAQRVLDEFSKRHQAFVHALKTDLSQALQEDPPAADTKDQAWPLVLNRILNEGSSEEIKLGNRYECKPMYSKRHPALYEKVKLFQEWKKSNFEESMNESHLGYEKTLLADLEELFFSFHSEAPKILDFEALEAELWRASQQEESQTLSEHQAPELFIVDEFQDTNKRQLDILEALSGENTQWYFVGDPKQSIYSFRNADISIFNSLKERLNCKRLSTNWRSAPELLSFLNNLGDELFDPKNSLDPAPQPLSASEKKEFPPQKTAPVQVQYCEKPHERWKAVSESFKKQSKLESKAHRSHAVLFRSWKKLYAFAEYLRQEGIPFEVLGKENYLDHHLSFLLCRYLEDQEFHSTGLGEKIISRWQNPSEFQLAPKAIEQEETEDDAPSEQSEQAWQSYLKKFYAMVAPQRWYGGRQWCAAVEKLFSKLSAELLQFQISPGQLAGIIGREAKTQEVELLSFVKPQSAAGHRLSLLTIHASKGLEFDYVYLPELYERVSNFQDKHISGAEELSGAFKFFDPKRSNEFGSLWFEHQRRKQHAIKNAEQKRLLYVAATRAKLGLKFFYKESAASKTKSKDWAGIVDWPGKGNDYWNELVDTARQKSGSSCQLIESEEKSPSAEITADEFWLVPEDFSEQEAAPAYYREGVSRFLSRSRQEVEEIAQQKSRRVERDLGKGGGTDFGTKLHHYLSIWDGNQESLVLLLEREKEKTELAECMLAARELEGLRPIWEAVGTTNLRREFEMIIDQSAERRNLNGVADMIFFESKESVWILDWKSSKQMKNLLKKDRLDDIHAQLEFYAYPYRQLGMKVRLCAVGLSQGKAKIILDQQL